MQLIDRVVWSPTEDGAPQEDPHGDPHRDSRGDRHGDLHEDPLGDLHEDPLKEGGALAEFVARRHRVPTFARSYHFHGISTAGPPDPALLRTLRPLQGKFTVVNPAPTLPLPDGVARRVGRIARAAAERSRRGGRVDGLEIQLHEPAQRLVRHETFVPNADGTSEVRFQCELVYRLVVMLGAGGGDGASASVAADAPVRRVARAVPWFGIALLTPDAEALRLMEAGTQHHYRHVTGRLGNGSHDSYWYADTWERYHEPGRIVGCIHPDAIDHTIASRGSSPLPPDALIPAEDFLFGNLSGERSSWGDYSPRSERHFFPPPGYCLIHYACWLELALADGAARLEAA